MHHIVHRASPAIVLLAVGLAGCASNSAARAGSVAASSYVAFVANEASDIVNRVVFTPPASLVLERRLAIGVPGRIAGPHGLAVSPNGRFWYLSLSHGMPNGRVARYAVANDSLLANVSVGLFPETIAITPDGEYLFVTNHAQHDREAISAISIVFAATMTEVARPNTCLLPQGGRMNATGSRHYSVCGGSDQLVEIDARSFQVTHRFGLTPDREALLGNDDRGGRRVRAGCSPTWAAPGLGARDGFVYVACSARDEIIEIDVARWAVTRRFPAKGSPYHLAIDARGDNLFATMHSDTSVRVFDLAAGTERARIRTSQSSPHGFASTPDGRYLFVTSEGSGSARGTIDVISLATLQIVASTEVGYAPGGVDVIARW